MILRCCNHFFLFIGGLTLILKWRQTYDEDLTLEGLRCSYIESLICKFTGSRSRSPGRSVQAPPPTLEIGNYVPSAWQSRRQARLNFQTNDNQPSLLCSMMMMYRLPSVECHSTFVELLWSACPCRVALWRREMKDAHTISWRKGTSNMSLLSLSLSLITTSWGISNGNGNAQPRPSDWQNAQCQCLADGGRWDTLSLCQSQVSFFMAFQKLRSKCDDMC